MHQVVKEIGIYAAILLLVIGGIWTYNNYKEDVLGYSLNLLETKLLAMVSDPHDRAAIKKMYAKFTNEVREQQLPPGHLETIAANILNLSNNDAKLTPDQVEAILYIDEIPKINVEIDSFAFENFSFEMTSLPPIPDVDIPPIEIPDIDIHNLPPVPRVKPAPRPQSAEPEKFVVVGKRLKALCEFNDKMQTMMREHPPRPDAPGMQKQWQFRNENGLKVVIDPEVKLKMKHQAIRNLDKEIARLENDKLVDWHKDLRKDLEHEMKRVRRELISLGRMLQHETEEHAKTRQNVKAMLSLKELEAMNYMQEINVDSIVAAYSKIAIEKIQEAQRQVEKAEVQIKATEK